MKFREGYKPRRKGDSSFYGVVHNDAEAIYKKWGSLQTSHSMEDVFGTPSKKEKTEDTTDE